MTKFSKEITTLDLMLPGLFNGLTFTGFRALTVFIMVTFIFPYLLPVVFFVAIFMVLILKKSVRGLKECLATDGKYKGPIHDHLATIVNGLVTLRKYERGTYFRDMFVNDLEKSTNVVFNYYLVNRWIALHLDFLCLIFSCGATIFAVTMKDTISPDLLAYALTLLSELIMFFSITLRYSAEVESFFISANRLYKYTSIESEDLLVKDGDDTLSQDGVAWPWKGQIEFDDVTMRYRPELDPSIRNLTVTIEPKMKIGIVGRTGAGKSSIFQALFRLLDCDGGMVRIDGVNIADVGLHLLRKSIAFIPQ